MTSPKSEKVVMLLAGVLGAFGFLGIGHLYIGRVRRGVILLVSSWILVGTSIFCFIVWAMAQMVIPPPGQPIGEPPAYSLIFLAVSIVLFFGAVTLWIGQIFDAKAVCQNYNKQISGS